MTIAGNNFGATQGTSTVKFHNTLATSFTSWSNTSIVVTDPAGATDGYVVVTVNGVASNGVWFPAPNITSVSPSSGSVGTSVTVVGTNFRSTPGTITFNGTPGSPTSWGNTILVPVPAGATTGPVVVTTYNGIVSNGVTFTLTPNITNLSQTSGIVGSSVTIAGTNFSSSGTVTFNGTTASTTSWSNTSIAATVPNGATTGNVVVSVNGVPSNGVGFTVLPYIASLSTTSGGPGTPVTITGTSFGAIQGSSTVSFNTTNAAVSTWGDTSIAVTVPTGATPGDVVVTVNGQASNGVSFSTCGPPTYPCSSTSTANPGTISALFNSTTPSGASSCLGDCQNTTHYDTTINPSGTDCITRITDGAVLGGSSVGNVTNSGGDNDMMWSLNGDFLAVTISGAVDKFFQLTSSGGCAQVVNTGVPVISVTAPIAFSHVTDNVFYAMASNHILKKYTISSINSMPTPVTLFDFTAAGNCPGIPSGMTISGTGVFTPSNTDSRFTIELQTGAQNTAIWVASYDTTLGCATVNWQTGSVWTWCTSSCTSSTPPLGTFSTSGDICWGANPTGGGGGIHDAIQSFTGSYYYMTINGTWTQGACAGQAGNQFISWQIATLNNIWCIAGGGTSTGHCSSHPSPGVTGALAPSYLGFNTRPLSNLGGGFTTFLPSTFNPEDIHSAWPHPTGDDTYEWVGATDSVLASSTYQSGCSTSSVYCPTYPQNMIVGVNPTASNQAVAVFAHTFSCNIAGYAACLDGIGDQFGPGESIGAISQDGKWFMWGSSMLHGMGIDRSSLPRADLFVVALQ